MSSHAEIAAARANRQVKVGAKLNKRQRERLNNERKADAALSGGTAIAVEGQEAVAKTPHWFVELQWFRLLRGQPVVRSPPSWAHVLRHLGPPTTAACLQRASLARLALTLCALSP